jgi:hypothetical protein
MRIFRKIFFAATSFILFGSVTVTAPVYAQNFNQSACTGVTTVAGGNCNGAQAQNSINTVIRVAFEILSVVVGVAALIMIIVSGFRFITSSGDSSSVASARSGLTWALIGLVIVGISQFLVHFVLNAASTGRIQ